MAVQVSYPGVYVEEFAPGAPIQGVGTGTAAFIGVAAKGDLDLPIKLTSWESFLDTFGADPVPGFHLWYAVRGFFENGGQVCHVVRASNGSYDERDLDNRATNPEPVIKVRARQPGESGTSVSVTIKNVLANAETTLCTPSGPIASHTPNEISMAEDNSASVPAADVAARFRAGDWITVGTGGERVQVVRVSGAAIRVDPIEPPPPVGLPDSLPGTLALGDGALENGNSETLSTMGDADYIDALATLEAVDDVNLIAIPDTTAAAVQQVLIQHCELLADCFAVLDAQAGQPPFGPTSVEEHRPSLDSTRGYAALYYPWLKVRPAGSGAPIGVPPSGHVCGIIARSDSKRGVHKAPANEIVNGALAVERAISDVEHGQLNLQGINVIRVFAAGRPTLWGARTTATDTNWQYVNIRRLFLYLEESIQEGIRWAVFEPNNLQLWQKLKRTVTEFLKRAWRDGALFGATPEEAFYVRIDETLNPFSERALGRLIIEVGVNPSYPAEFIVVRIGIWEGGATLTES